MNKSHINKASLGTANSAIETVVVRVFEGSFKSKKSVSCVDRILMGLWRGICDGRFTRSEVTLNKVREWASILHTVRAMELNLEDTYLTIIHFSRELKFL